MTPPEMKPKPEVPQAAFAGPSCSALSREVDSRCAARFCDVAGLYEHLAISLAESQLENLSGDLSENPEQAADDEMSYWTDD
jgi:hypothetical protein